MKESYSTDLKHWSPYYANPLLWNRHVLYRIHHVAAHSDAVMGIALRDLGCGNDTWAAYSSRCQAGYSTMAAHPLLSSWNSGIIAMTGHTRVPWAWSRKQRRVVAVSFSPIKRLSLSCLERWARRQDKIPIEIHFVSVYTEAWTSSTLSTIKPKSRAHRHRKQVCYTARSSGCYQKNMVLKLFKKSIN